MEIRNYLIIDLFDISIAKSIDKPNLKIGDKGIKYISRRTDNNGLDCYVTDEIIGNKSKYSNKINKGNCISIAMVGAYKGSAFWQNDDFLSSQNILLLHSSKLNEKNAIFIIPIIEMIYKSSNNYTALKKSDFLKDEIPLPSILNKNGEYEPDWQYMEDYIGVVEKNVLINANPSREKINTNNLLKQYKIENLFEVKTSKFYNPNKLYDGKIPYVSRTTFNNGIDRFVDDNGINPYPGNCIIIGAESATAFYQKDPFITGNKIYRIYSKENNKLNNYIALYICTILNKESSKYSYSNAWISEKVKETKIFLPSILNNNGEYEPDWQYIEDYIKSLPYSSSI